MGHVLRLRHDGVLYDIIDRRMNYEGTSKPTRGRRRLQMLHDLTKCDGNVTLKRAAEDRKGRKYSE